MAGKVTGVKLCLKVNDAGWLMFLIFLCRQWMRNQEKFNQEKYFKGHSFTNFTHEDQLTCHEKYFTI